MASGSGCGSDDWSITPPIQEVDGRLFYDVVRNTLDWSDLSRDVVMDIGCGRGDNSTRLFLEYFPSVNSLVGIDSSAYNIAEAKKKFVYPRTKYYVADIENSSTLRCWEKRISKIVSTYCFNCLPEQQEAFQNVYNLLQPGGEAAIFFSLQSGYFDWFRDVTENPKWSPYFGHGKAHIPESHEKDLRADHYLSQLRQVGFEVIQCKDEKKRSTYSSDEACKGLAIGSCPLSEFIPEHLKAEYLRENFEIFLRYNARDESGLPYLKYRTLTALLRKPATIYV